MPEEAAAIGWDQVLGRLKMATACLLQWFPDSLYNTATSTVVVYYSVFRSEIKTLPESVQFDIYYKVFEADRFVAILMAHPVMDVISMVPTKPDKPFSGRNGVRETARLKRSPGISLFTVLIYPLAVVLFLRCNNWSSSARQTNMCIRNPAGERK